VDYRYVDLSDFETGLGNWLLVGWGQATMSNYDLPANRWQKFVHLYNINILDKTYHDAIMSEIYTQYYNYSIIVIYRY